MSREDKIQKLVEFALSMKDDPEIHRLPFPPVVLERLAAAGLIISPKEYSITDAVDRCFTSKITEKYTNSTIEVIDQTKMDIAFPAIPPVEPLPLPEEETKTETDVFTVVEKTETEKSKEPTLYIDEGKGTF